METFKKWRYTFLRNISIIRGAIKKKKYYRVTLMK